MNELPDKIIVCDPPEQPRIGVGRVINNLHNYLMERCVYGEWDDMTQAMMEAASVDDLREVHLSYLRRLHEQCLLNPKAKVVAIQIRKILNISLQCVGAIKRWIRLGSQRVEWEGDQVRRQEHVPYSAMPIEENRGLTQSLIHLDDLQLRFKKTNEFLPGAPGLNSISFQWKLIKHDRGWRGGGGVIWV